MCDSGANTSVRGTDCVCLIAALNWGCSQCESRRADAIRAAVAHVQQ